MGKCGAGYSTEKNPGGVIKCSAAGVSNSGHGTGAEINQKVFKSSAAGVSNNGTGPGAERD